MTFTIHCHGLSRSSWETYETAKELEELLS